jgi:TolA-binding protein
VTSASVPTEGQQELPVAPSLEPPLSPAPPAAVSRLAEQNDLFSAALAAERQGQHDLALRKLDELVTRYPDGPLSESARAERQRILPAK